MNKLLHRFILAGVLLLTAGATAHAQDKNFYVFLCFGQSNMEGYPGIPEEDKTSIRAFKCWRPWIFPS
jgi:hypothetical protein